MNQPIQIKAQKRNEKGTGASRAVRRQGQIPAIIYGGNAEPQNVSVDELTLTRAYIAGGFYSKAVVLDLDGQPVRVLPREVQVHPVTDAPLHADFLRLVKGHPITVNVRVMVKGADKSPGIRRGGNLNLVRHTVQFVCDSDHIPDSITIDVSELEIGDSVHISHVQLPAGATPTIKDRDFTIATIVGRISEDETKPAQAEAATPAAAAKAPGKDDKK